MLQYTFLRVAFIIGATIGSTFVFFYADNYRFNPISLTLFCGVGLMTLVFYRLRMGTEKMKKRDREFTDELGKDTEFPSMDKENWNSVAITSIFFFSVLFRSLFLLFWVWLNLFLHHVAIFALPWRTYLFVGLACYVFCAVESILIGTGVHRQFRDLLLGRKQS